jgi:metal-responsive CopG/Arc/MetJ family transcriptional regulator
MERYNHCFPDDLMADLKKISEETGAPVSELLRRAAKEYIEHWKKKKSSKGN